MSFKCIHLSDIHFRGLSRHREYRESFRDFFKQITKLNPDLIFIGGDIVHSKTQGISPELVDILTWWFKGLANIAPTHIILGNHDGLISNKDRQDAISPIINAIDDDRLFLYKKSGTYPTGIDGFNWCIFSCFDEENWENVRPIKGEINIAAYHGAVRGSQVDTDWTIEGEIESEFFSEFDFAFLGDIHKFQYLDEENRIAYPGSAIQQNYGEDLGKGYLFWDIDNKQSFTSKFFEIAHHQPFITINWQGTVAETMAIAHQYPNNSRFRIKHISTIPQTEIKHFHAELKEKKKATEVVWRLTEDDSNRSVIINSSHSTNLNLRDSSVVLDLIKQYHAHKNIDDEIWEKIEPRLKNYCEQISKSDNSRNIKWSLRSVKFENTFGYGKKNLINFENLSGVVGLFGRNRAGKSSIPGTIMYGLFNSNDRGIVKNLHIINTRKGHCRTDIDFAVNGIPYRLERQTIKKQARNGKLSASTHLNLFQLNQAGETIKDISGEQRKDTDKFLRNLIGAKEDFLLTSFASQGEMNAFIKCRATKRKEILANFLNLDIFEKILELAKNDSTSIKALLDRSPNREWNTLLVEKNLKLRNIKLERDSMDTELSSLRSRLDTLKLEANELGDTDIVTPEDIDFHKKKLATVRDRLEKITTRDGEIKLEISDINNKINKIISIKQQFPIDGLKEKIQEQSELEKTLINIEHSLEKSNAKLKNQKRSIQILESVPCEDQFPTCRFIKNSYKNKNNLESQMQEVQQLKDQLSALKRSLKKLLDENLQEKHDKYQKLLQKETAFKLELSDIQIEQNNVEREINDLGESIIILGDELAIMGSRVVSESEGEELNSLKKQINELGDRIKTLDAHRLSLSENIGLSSSAVSQLEKERDEYYELLYQWGIYDTIMSAVSKKGIPLQILTSMLPQINAEIAKILQSVVGFTVELNADESSNSMDVYINYGDSKRIIECASGMEKMISSLAIRVALINISSLPKSDVLIIDEGFGSLDEMNVEACNRLLQNLKKWFRTILVISHVDAVKDGVDNILEINHNGKDASVWHE